MVFFHTKFIKLMIYLHGIRKRGDNLLPKYYKVKTDVHCSHNKSTKHKEHESFWFNVTLLKQRQGQQL